MKSPTVSKRAKISVGVVLAFVILLLVLNPLVSSIVGRMVESRLEEKLEAEIEIGKLRLNLFTGRATAEGFQLTYLQPNSNRLLVDSQLLDTKLNLLPILTADTVEIPWVTLHRPHIRYERKAKGEEVGIIDRTKRIKDWLDDRKRKKEAQKVAPKKRYEVTVAEIEIADGRVDWIDYTISDPPLATTFDELNFKSDNFSSQKPLQFLMDAEFQGALIAGGEKGSIHSKRTYDPTRNTQHNETVILSINIAHFAPYFGISPADQGVILLKGGRLDYRYNSALRKQPWKLLLDSKLNVRGLELTLNPDADPAELESFAPRQLIEYSKDKGKTFIASRVVKYVEKRGSNFTLDFQSEWIPDNPDGEISEVLEDLLFDIFKGAMKAVFAQISDRIEGSINDTTLAAKSKTALIKSPDIQARYIDVDVADGVVSLIGAVKSESAKTTAEGIVAQLEAVADVRNLLEVYPKLGEKSESRRQRVQDSWITGKVRTKLGVDRDLKSLNLKNVDTVNGVVLLVGKVGSEAEKQQALAIVRQIKGVERVIDLITIVKDDC